MSDRAVPDVVVWPRTADEVAAVLRLATARAVPVVPRGGGSNLCAATVATRGGIVLVLTRMDTILDISRDELLARVEAGATTAALSDAAAAHGLQDVAGYDLTRLLTGSEGTLGVLTEITVALPPMPATTGTGPKVPRDPTTTELGPTRTATAVVPRRPGPSPGRCRS